MDSFFQNLLSEQSFISVIFTILLGYVLYRNNIREDKYIEMLDYYYRMKQIELANNQTRKGE